MEWRTVLESLVTGHDLVPETAHAVMNAMMSGEASEIEIAAFLTALRAKGATGAELAEFAKVMQAHAVRVEHILPDVLDTCGTGGGIPSFNLSTAAALVASAAGATVAKHGNRAMTSKCGSADVLEALGVNVSAPLDTWVRTLHQLRVAFLFAPSLHPAMKHVGPVRRALGIRTVFNQLGPLANPARAQRQIIGVYDAALLRPMAEGAQGLGIHRAWIVIGQDGLDEVSPCSPTRVAEVTEHGIQEFVVNPADFGQHPVADHALAPGESPEENAAILREAITSVDSERALAVVPIAAAALFVCGRAESLAKAADLARTTISEGKAAAQLDALIEATRG